MSEEQREWKQQLANSREDVKLKFDDILHELARNLKDSPFKSAKPSRVDVGIQTETIQETSIVPSHSPGMILANNVNVEPFSGREINAPGPNSIMERHLPHEAEQLRAELAAASAQIVLQESSIRSLQQSTMSLRQSLDEYYREREGIMVQLRHAQAEELTHRSVRERIGLDLERATMEVERLRDEIGTFHHPNSRTYQSVKDAVQREMRGEAPMTPIVLKRTVDTQMDGIDDGVERARKRHKGSSNPSPVQPQVPTTAQPPRPQRSSTLSDLPRLTTNIETNNQMHPPQSSGTLSSAQLGPFSAGRPVIHNGPMSAPPSQSRPSGSTYSFQDSGSQPPGGQSGPQGPHTFVRPIDPSRRLSHIPPGFNLVQTLRPSHPPQSQPYTHSYPPLPPPSASHPVQPRAQDGQSHRRSRSSSNAHPTAPASTAYPNSEQFLTHPQALARYFPTTSNQSPPRPLSPSLGVAIPAGWQSNDLQQERVNGNGPPPGPRPGQSSFSFTGHPTIQRPVPVPFSQVIDLTSPASLDGEIAPKESKHVPTDLLDPSAQRLCTLLYEVNSDHRILMCRACGHISGVPTDNLVDTFMHSYSHRKFFDISYEKVFPPRTR